MVHEKIKPMVQVHKRETLLHNKNRITHLKKNSIKNYILLHFSIYMLMYISMYIPIHNSS